MWPDQRVSDHIFFFFLLNNKVHGAGCRARDLGPVRMRALLPPAVIAQLLAVCQNMLCVLYVLQ